MAEAPAAESEIDLDRLQIDAHAVVARLIGDARLGELVTAMLDHETPPSFLWRLDYPSLNVIAERTERHLRDCLNALSDKDKLLLAEIRRLPLDRDPVRALLEVATAPGYFALPASLLEPPAPSTRVFAMVPALISRLDNRGLIDITGLDARPDALFVGEWAVPYHQFLRRRFSSGINDALIGELVRQAGMGRVVRVALDERRLHRADEHVRRMEFDYWNGPAISEERLDDPGRRGVEVLVHRWPADAGRLAWDNVEQASIRTALDGDLRTIEIEEVIDPARNAKCDFQLVRYAHAQRDIGRHSFVHVDGAVRFYTPPTYEVRRAARWPTADDEQPAGRRKVFRVDGDMDTATWCELVALWFRGNELVREALQALA
jgi:hypothetical protein